MRKSQRKRARPRRKIRSLLRFLRTHHLRERLREPLPLDDRVIAKNFGRRGEAILYRFSMLFWSRTHRVSFCGAAGRTDASSRAPAEAPGTRMHRAECTEFTLRIDGTRASHSATR